MARIPSPSVKVLANAAWFCRVLIDALFPRVCTICQRPMPVNSFYNAICDACSKDICWVDSRTVDALFERYKREAMERGERVFFNNGVTCWEHSGVARMLILALKYKCASFLIKDIVAMIKKNAGHLLNFVANSLLIPVPMHYFKRICRDYSQTELLADALSKCTNARVAKKLLTCKSHTAQANLTTAERLLNVWNVFNCNESGLSKATRIVIVDDVITTGATLFACCAAMHRCGFRDINILTLSYGGS
jgi:predicted amidophosphoribosyltransferase